MFNTLADIILERIHKVDGVILILQKRNLKFTEAQSLVQFNDRITIQLHIHYHHATEPPPRPPNAGAMCISWVAHAFSNFYTKPFPFSWNTLSDLLLLIIWVRSNTRSSRRLPCASPLTGQVMVPLCVLPTYPVPSLWLYFPYCVKIITVLSASSPGVSLRVET